MINATSISEYYFEYDLEQVGVDSGAGAYGIQAPNLYFERDYRKKNLPYSLITVPKEWLGTQNIHNQMANDSGGERTKELLNSLPYDSIRIIYDIGGIDYKPLLDPSSREYKEAANNRVVPYKEFYQRGGGIVVDDTSEEHSGVGVIEMLKQGRSIARFAFAVNCIRRKKISYIIRRTKDNLINLRFLCKSMPQGLSVVLVHHPSRLPCLKEDKEKNTIGEITLNFDKPEISKNIKLNNELIQNQHIFSLAFKNEDLNKYYHLDCKKNETMDTTKHFDALLEMPERSCPFCHSDISPNIINNDHYKKGGVACHKFKKGTPLMSLPVIYTSRKGKVKNCLYCAEDLIPYNRDESNNEDAGRFREGFLRLLPSDFMNHQTFKIAFVGSARAGKTTYISRFFGITGDERQISMPMTMTANALRTFGLDVRTAVTEQLAAVSSSDAKEKRYEATERNWAESNEQYIERRLTLEPHYPGATTTGDYTKYPFIAEVNNKAYISFYDIAGEDAQHSMQIRSMANDKPIGVFCIVNGEPDTSGNSSVVNMLLNADLPKDSPIAVIVTKMDNFEKAFDASCHCLNTDYFYKIRSYDKSELEKEIDLSSEEIKSYLAQNGLLPDFGMRYKNVKYFGVSSFNFGDSIHKPGENLNSVGKVYFECSSKHLELPFVWMMRQFGLIK